MSPLEMTASYAEVICFGEVGVRLVRLHTLVLLAETGPS